uniref:Uncharacterized protein n=1 Tax=Oryza brachyantha TaxID=4533 RepID=J3MNI2_ORYBR
MTTWSGPSLTSGLLRPDDFFHERPDFVDELPGVVGELREDVEGVYGVRELHHPRRPPLPPQHGAVPPAPVMQRVEPPDHHHRWRERLRQLVLRATVVAAGDVRGRVVPVGPLRQERLPRQVRPPGVQHRRHAVQRALRFRPLLAAEARLHEYYAGGVVGTVRRRRRVRPAVGHVVRDVAAGAVPGDEAGGDVDWADVAGEASGGEVTEDGFPVVVRGGGPVLGGETVVDGHDDGAEAAAQRAAEGVVGAGSRGEQRDPAAVEVDDDGSRRRRALRHGENARPEAAGRVDGDVRRADAGGVRPGIGRRPAVEQGEERTVDAAVSALRHVDGGLEAAEPEPHRPRQGHPAAPAVRGRHFLATIASVSLGKLNKIAG